MYVLRFGKTRRGRLDFTARFAAVPCGEPATLAAACGRRRGEPATLAADGGAVLCHPAPPPLLPPLPLISKPSALHVHGSPFLSLSRNVLLHSYEQQNEGLPSELGLLSADA